MAQSQAQGCVINQLFNLYDDLAPDGSEIRLLPTGRGSSMVHCTLHPGKTSKAVTHRTVEEIWYCISGEGEVWRKIGDMEQVVAIRPGTSLTIPTGAHFQFRNTGSEPLCILIATTPPWPGPEEAVVLEDHWEKTPA